jgi:hypothetical protein
MIATVLVCAFGVIAADQASSPRTDLVEYTAAAAQVPRAPEAQVKLALWCEAHGLKAEALKHLARAVLIDPKNAAAVYSTRSVRGDDA